MCHWMFVRVSVVPDVTPSTRSSDAQDTVQRYTLLQNTLGSKSRLFGQLAVQRPTFRHAVCAGGI